MPTASTTCCALMTPPATGAGLKRLPVDAAVRARSPLGDGRLAVALDDGLLVLELANDIAATEPPGALQAS
jgi:hypothetical protein